MPRKWTDVLPPAIGLVLFCAALWAMHHALAGFHYRDLQNAVHAITSDRILGAVLLTIIGYFILTGYDVLAFRYIQHGLPYRRIALTSFLGYALSNNVGYAFLSGGSVRYRFYSSWGLNALDIAKVISFCTLMGWMGFSTLAGIACVLEPRSVLMTAHLPLGMVRPIGAAFLTFSMGYLALALRGRGTLRVRGWEFPLPSRTLALGQVALGTLDFAVAGGVLYLLLPPEAPFSFFAFIGFFMIALVAGLLSQVPGGLGVFEGVLLYLLTPSLPADRILGALLLFRLVYYILPLLIAILLLAGYELRQRRAAIARVSDAVTDVMYPILPHAFAFFAVLCGALLLFSGATPPEHTRLYWLHAFLPLSFIEASHFAASLVGMLLLLVGRALQRRIDAAYWLTVLLLAAGIGFSLGKGFDYEEAGVLAMMLIAMLPCHRHFTRRASLLAPDFSPGWIMAIGLVVLGSVWIMFFAHKHVEYTNELWWRFSLEHDAPRALRAELGAIVLAMVISVGSLLRPAQRTPEDPTDADLKKVEEIIATAPQTTVHLALLGDKHFFFNPERTAFLMYAPQGRSWICMGGPVGPESEKRDLIWAFRELCDEVSVWPVFYQVRPEDLPHYLDAGLSLLKLGEEARVPLETFSLDGHAHKEDRYVVRKFEKEGYVFEIAPVEAVPALLPQLRAISIAWLTTKNVREKRFSLGNFNDAYLSRFPQALIRREGRIVAFANILTGAGKQELSIDLMRHTTEAPAAVMHFLFAELMLWGKEQGYAWFNLGMAPLAGLENRAAAPLWNRFGALVYRHGEAFYNFQGLRSYKEKFAPIWEPRYLACPGGFVRPAILADVATLIAGGPAGVVKK
jgi:phosphatidylglycerol lysyltransferase